jgi:Predicted tagatose 6-phosphate kinase
MVEDGIAILKVGPALTFALREGLFVSVKKLTDRKCNPPLLKLA